MNPARRLERPSVGEALHVSLTRSQLQRLAKRGVHLRTVSPAPATAEPAAPEGDAGAHELRRDLAARRVERDALARRVEVLLKEKVRDQEHLKHLEEELLERERRIASLHAQLVHWQHHARRAQQGSRHAQRGRASAPTGRPSLLDPLPRRVIAEVRESLERTAADPRPWLSPARLSPRTRQRWIAALAILAVVTPVAGLTRRFADPAPADSGAPAWSRAERPLGSRIEATATAGPPLPPEVLTRTSDHVLGVQGTRPPWLPKPAAMRAAASLLSTAETLPVSGPPLPPRAFGPPRIVAQLSTELLVRAALVTAVRATVPEPAGWPDIGSGFPAASPTQRRCVAREMRGELGAGLGLVGWGSTLEPSPEGAPRELVAFPVVGSDLAHGPIGLWLWVGERHDPEARVYALGEQARTWSSHARAPRPDAVPPAELLRSYAGIALRLQAPPEVPVARRLRRIPLHREAGAGDPDAADVVVFVRRGSSDTARLRALARAALGASGREAGRVAFHELAPRGDARGWEELRTGTIELSIRDDVPESAAASPR